MQGNCTSPLPAYAAAASLGGSPLATPQPQQCLLLVDAAAIQIGEGDLWLGNVLLRFKSTARSTAESAGGSPIVEVGSEGRLWMTNVTMQGHGAGTSVQTLFAQGPTLCSGVFVFPSTLAFLQPKR